MTRTAIVVVLLTLCAPILHAQQCPGKSAWTNQRGSTLYIESITTQGLIAGNYINRAAGFHCQNSPYPVTGWVLQGTNTITFSVKWENAAENCQSQTAWIGFLSPDCKKLNTSWELVRNGTTDPSQILKGADEFNRTAQHSFATVK